MRANNIVSDWNHRLRVVVARAESPETVIEVAQKLKYARMIVLMHGPKVSYPIRIWPISSSFASQMFCGGR